MKMMHSRFTLSRVILVTVGLCLVLAAPICAQYTVDHQANVISGVASNWNGDYDVGSNTFADALLILNGGVLSNRSGYLGYETSSSNNIVLIIGAGAVWSNAADLYLGFRGANNQLTIAAGGQVFSDSSFLGFDVGSSNNSALITGAGSVWSNEDEVYVGGDSAGNSLVISNGGKMLASSISIGSDFGSGGASNTTVLVTDGGVIESLTSDGDFWGTILVGDSGAANRMVISDGGQVFNHFSWIGNTEGSSNNSVLVTGTGSVWNASHGFYLGFAGAGNRFTIANGGQVFNADAYLGMDSSASNNTALVTDPDSLWSCSYGLTVGYNTAGNSLIISNGGQVVTRPHGDSLDGVGFVDGGTNRLLITGTGSVWSNDSGFFIGMNTSSNSVVLADGGHLINAYAVLGQYGGMNNIASVTGTAAVWQLRSNLFVGDDGSNSSLVISNSGQVIDGSGFIGTLNPSSGNSVRVVDRAVWQNDVLYVGNEGSSNSLTVAGGSVLASNLVIGVNTATCDNWVQLDSGSVIVTNATHNAVLEVGRGTFILTGGVLQADKLVITNDCAQFFHNGGTLLYNQLVLDPNLDADGDGIPNGYEQSHGLDPLNPADTNLDADGDGLSNFQEYIAGTDPTNSASSFRITSIVREGNDIRVTWDSVSNRWYYVQTNAPPVNGSYANNFTDLSDVIIASGTKSSYLDSGGATNKPARYYRVRLYSGPI